MDPTVWITEATIKLFGKFIENEHSFSKDKLQESCKEFLKERANRTEWDKFTNQYHKVYLENADLTEEIPLEKIADFLYDNSERMMSVYVGDGVNGMRTCAEIRDNLINEVINRFGNENGRNKQAIRQCCNSLIDFFGELYLGDMDKSAKFITAEIRDGINTVRNDIKRYIQTLANEIKHMRNDLKYHNSFAQYVEEKSRIPNDGKGSLVFNNPSIIFHGRKKELEYIDKFMNDMRRVLFMSITGFGGVGKSKLALHVSKQYMDKSWTVVWVGRYEIDEILEKYAPYGRHVLFVCDYAGMHVEKIARLMKKVAESNNTHSVRFLLLERASYETKDFSDRFDTWYKKLCGEYSDIENIEYASASLNLNNCRLEDEACGEILDDRAKNEGTTFTAEQKSEIIDFAKNILSSSGENERTTTTSIRCLFLLLTADACLSGEDYKSWDAQKLISFYIDRIKKAIPMEIVFPALCLLAFATAHGEFDFYDDIPAIENDRNEIDKYYQTNDQIEDFLATLCEKSKYSTTVTPLYPDLVGEYLFVYVFFRLKEPMRRLWFKAFADEWRNLDKVTYFEKFLSHCVCDWISDNRANSVIDDMINMIDNDEDARIFSISLFNATIDVNTAEKNFAIAEKIQPLYDVHNTPEIARIFSIFIFNVTIDVNTAEERLAVAEIIQLLYDVHNTPEIALEYARALVNAAAAAQSAEEALTIAAEMIKPLYYVHNTPEIATLYAAAWANVAVIGYKYESTFKYAELAKQKHLEIAKECPDVVNEEFYQKAKSIVDMILAQSKKQ